jgi:hypothetical protein
MFAMGRSYILPRVTGNLVRWILHAARQVFVDDLGKSLSAELGNPYPLCSFDLPQKTNAAVHVIGARPRWPIFLPQSY